MTISSDIDVLRDAYDEQLRGITATSPAGVRCERDGRVLRVHGQFRGFVTAPRDVGVCGRRLDELIARQRDFFARRGEAVEWKTRGHDLPQDLPERLAAAGFVPEERETVLIGRTAELAAAPALPAGVTLRRLTSALDLRRVAALESEVWGQDMGWLGDDLIGRVAAAPEQIAVLAAEAGGTLVCAAWLVLRAGTDFAGLWGGCTHAGWRGRGVYRALVAARAELAAARGVPYLQVDASDDSAPILRRLGFLAVTTTTPYVWTPPGGSGAGGSASSP